LLFNSHQPKPIIISQLLQESKTKKKVIIININIFKNQFTKFKRTFFLVFSFAKIYFNIFNNFKEKIKKKTKTTFKKK